MKKEINNNSHELNDIIERFPSSFNSILLYLLILVIILSIALSYIIESPDIIKGYAELNSTNPIAELSFRNNGRVKYLIDSSKKEVFKGEYLVIIENSGSFLQIKKIKNLLEQSINITNIEKNYKLFEELITDNNLGDIQISASNLFANLNKYIKALNSKEYLKQREIILNQVSYYRKILKDRTLLYFINNKRFKYSTELMTMNDSLYSKDVISKAKLLEKKRSYLKEEEEVISNKIIKNTTELKITELEHQIIKLEIENEEKLKIIILEIELVRKNLLNEIDRWELNYIIKAPYNGTVERLNFVPNGSYVNAGRPMLSVIPNDREINCNAFVPIKGAGKLKEGQNVKIKLKSYPYQEFGYIKGIVSSISSVPSNNQYIISIKLENDTITNTGVQLSLSNKLEGDLEVITEKRKLIERLFIKLKYLFEPNS
ncbi:HlyD family secretion protein [Polaribacter sp. MSW13]|uniref:HlyD family secretion protein n=1 Tax=Polaribacter marinus TaxID=2916838 RepID=A0A9X1VPD3_9FLAO|nr:HlyD family efflux transporter periplasmic adaptor subunit [Polaribacter marinus]MCI2229952.1 HlyD family secretion protein [Polaribacter marinus]